MKILKLIKDPLLAAAYFFEKYPIIRNDRLQLKVSYYCRFRKKLDLEHPQTFNQKLQWLKLHNSSDLCTQMVDKYGVREIIKNKIGEEYLIPIYGVYDSFEDIDFDKLPNQFVLKCTHDSGSIVICKDKNKLDINAARKKLTKHLKHNYFYVGREMPYKNIPPRIVAERYMVNHNTAGEQKKGGINDYKFFCFNGIPTLVFYVSGRFEQAVANFDFYDINNLTLLPFGAKGHPHSPEPIEKPVNFDKMVDIARLFSKGFPFLRVDLYEIDGKIYFGEFTFHHDGGFVPFEPEEWDYKLGEMINLEGYK